MIDRDILNVATPPKPSKAERVAAITRVWKERLDG